MWSCADIADAIEAGLRQRAADDDLEQTVYGFDHLDELGLHPILQRSLRTAGYGVWPEQRYPADWGKRTKSEGKRCDIVLTRSPDAPLRDPQVKGTLFDTTGASDPQEAYWLEVKTVAQHETSGPFTRYAAELLAPVAADVKKLWGDGLIFHAGLLLVLFTETRDIALHDIQAWHRRCMDRGFPVAAPCIRGFEITERIGNGYCAVAVFGVRGR